MVSKTIVAVLAAAVYMYVAEVAMAADSPKPACIVDVGLVVDNSGSIRDSNLPGQDNWDFVVKFLMRLVSMLHVDAAHTRIGLVEFGNRGYFGFDFAAHKTAHEVISTLNQTLRFRGENTNTTGGMRMARERLFNGTRRNASRIMLVITDGVPTFDADKLKGEVDQIKAMDIRIMAIGVTNQVNESLLKDIVTKPSGDNYFYSKDFSNLNKIVQKVLFNQMCGQPSEARIPPLRALLATPMPTRTVSEVATVQKTTTDRPTTTFKAPKSSNMKKCCCVILMILLGSSDGTAAEVATAKLRSVDEVLAVGIGDAEFGRHDV